MCLGVKSRTELAKYLYLWMVSAAIRNTVTVMFSQPETSGIMGAHTASREAPQCRVAVMSPPHSSPNSSV